ncbi:MAG: endonuclease MutS2 [Paludibacteraceae bacterium]
MIYPENFEQKIGFHLIRKILSENCVSELGQKHVEKIAFLTDFESILCELSKCDEYCRILSNEEEKIPVAIVQNLEPTLLRLRIEGTYINEKECFELKNLLDTAHHISRYIQLRKEKYFYLNGISEHIQPIREITQRIEQLFNKFWEVRDSASEKLFAIRKNLKTAQASATSTLNAILNHAKVSGYIEKDTNPTLREGRLVIPLSPMYKNKIKGIIHDESASGKTIFVEPTAVVEINNHIRELEGEERREIIRILTVLSDFIRPFIPQILHTQDYLGAIDAIQAKALFAQQINAIKPYLSDKSVIEWENAFHPLLYLSLSSQGKKIVPLNIKINEHQRILIISGANAGGKSVCLKTVALLQYMLQCGIPIPIHESSKAGVFNHIFLDIGDEQSIENDLSTYSSHLLNMKFFMQNATPKSLLLIDEFGSGTEPQIGGAIAEAILNNLNQKKAFGVITTHYTNLKQFAKTNEGVVNGAMLYDRQGMRPLFQLQIGNPGSSFAIEIAHKIGLPESVIAEATQKAGNDFVNFDKYLQDIVRDKRYWENKRQQIRLKEKQTEELLARYEQELTTLHKNEKNIIREAKNKAEQLISNANAEIEKTIREIKESAANREVTQAARNELSRFKNEQKKESITPTEQKIKAMQRRKHFSENNTEKTDNSFSINDYVAIKESPNAIGKVLDIKNNIATVVFGNIKSKIEIERLEKARHQQRKNFLQNQPSITINESGVKERKDHFKPEIDIRGMRGEEALQALIYFIDDALMMNIGRVRILHGTGNGVLRQLTRNYLSGIGEIRFHDEHVQFGGAGITVVEL